MKFRTISNKIFISLLSFIFALVCLELSLRKIWNNHDWWNKPQVTEQYRYPINQYGFRDYSYTKDKPENTVRIVCFGDSFTFGGGIKFDDTYAKRLERSLNTKLAPLTNKKYEVLNISWSGYSSYQEINKLDLIKEFKPDLLILGYCLNDTEDWTKLHTINELRQQYILRKKPEGFLKRLYQISYLASYSAYKLSNIKIATGTTRYYKKIYEDTYSGWRRTAASFKILGKQKIPVIVAIFPLLSYPFEKYPFLDIHAKIHNELEKNRLPFIDLYESFKNEDYLRLQAVPYANPHPSEIANRITEEHLYNKLTKDYNNVLEGKNSLQGHQ